MKTRKKKISLTVMMIIFLGLVVAQDVNKSRGSLYTDEKLMKNRPREARNFRPETLSTAPGFGKRRDIFKSAGSHRAFISSTVSNLPQRVLICWILHARKHADLMRRSRGVNGEKRWPNHLKAEGY